ncbi:hypothetical protein A5683_17455 [Mycobacterium mantenii]|uniref:Mce protein n=1 Tax=Mycobacterium mantenii TaxID=560555 RepID=A0A1A2TP59_MYCNT|nr:hypothetical protein A5688_11735 [Mycobacterium mantenii]OBH78166.1 hypothetical protein A5683_17455 [Mycobacterium mantenii]
MAGEFEVAEATEPNAVSDAEDEDGGTQAADSIAPEGGSNSIRRRLGMLRRTSRRTVVAACGTALLVVAVAAAATMGWQLHKQREIDEAAQQALAVAQQYAIVLTSVDAANLDQNFSAVLNGATGEFKDMYSQSSSQLKQVLIDSKARAQGKVIASGIKSATTHKVEVMVFLDQSVTNSLNPQPRLDRNRIILTMEKVGGRWLASKVDLP